MTARRVSFFGSSVVPFRLVFIMWLVFSLEVFLHINLGHLGIRPRTLTGLIGIFTAPMIHGDLTHLISNTIPLLFLGSTLFFFYERIAGVVFFVATSLQIFWYGSSAPAYHIISVRAD
jgi:membrane associated rhomboid family serine protease